MSKNVFIPHDLVVEVLSRLGVKSLMRFKCVSKSWCRMISQPEPEFHKRHLKQSKSKMKLGVASNSCNKSYVVDLTLLDEIGISNWKEIKYPRDMGVITGCSNGVVCISAWLESFVLWNPSTQNHLRLPNCNGFHHSQDKYHYGVTCFGYDESMDDYKVARLIKYFGGNRTYRMDIFSLKSYKWRTLDDFTCESNIYNPSYQGIVVNGALHWLLEDHSILAFNLGTERFQVLPPIQEAIYRRPYYLSEGILNGCHYLILNDSMDQKNKWMMKNNSWSRFTLNNLSSASTQLFLMKPMPLTGFDFEIYNFEKLSSQKIRLPFPVKEEVHHRSYLYFENLFPLHYQEEQVGKGQKSKQFI